MEIFGIAALTAVTAILLTLIRRGSDALALLGALAASAVILVSVLGDVRGVFEKVTAFTSGLPAGSECLSAVLKAVGIALLGELSAAICKDAGENALAATVALAAKAAILLSTLPLLEKVFTYLGEIVRL